MFDDQVASHDIGDVRIWKKDVNNSVFELMELKAIHISYHLWCAFGIFPVDTESIGSGDRDWDLGETDSDSYCSVIMVRFD